MLTMLPAYLLTGYKPLVAPATIMDDPGLLKGGNYESTFLMLHLNRFMVLHGPYTAYGFAIPTTRLASLASSSAVALVTAPTIVPHGMLCLSKTILVRFVPFHEPLLLDQSFYSCCLALSRLSTCPFRGFQQLHSGLEACRIILWRPPGPF